MNRVFKSCQENTDDVNTFDLKKILIELKNYKEFYVEESIPNNLLKITEFQRNDLSQIKIANIESIYSSIYELKEFIKESLLKLKKE